MMWKMRILIIVGVSLICIGIGAMLFEVLPFQPKGMSFDC
jgi:hypothetical protein